MLKKQILSILMSVSLLSGLNSMGNTNYNRLPKKELIRRLQTIDGTVVQQPHVAVPTRPAHVEVVQPVIVKEDKPGLFKRSYSFIARNKGKLFLTALASAIATGYYLYPGQYENALDMARILIESRFIPQSNVTICKTLERTGWFNRLLNGSEYTTCNLARSMNFKEIFNAFYR